MPLLLYKLLKMPRGKLHFWYAWRIEAQQVPEIFRKQSVCSSSGQNQKMVKLLSVTMQIYSLLCCIFPPLHLVLLSCSCILVCYFLVFLYFISFVLFSSIHFNCCLSRTLRCFFSLLNVLCLKQSRSCGFAVYDNRCTVQIEVCWGYDVFWPSTLDIVKFKLLQRYDGAHKNLSFCKWVWSRIRRILTIFS